MTLSTFAIVTAMAAALPLPPPAPGLPPPEDRSSGGTVEFKPRWDGNDIVSGSKRLSKEVKRPEPWIPRVKKSHVHEFFAAIREGRRANADFRYGVPLVKTVLLGNVLAQTGLGKVEWDGSRVTNNPAANAFVKTTYRPGWELPEV